MAKRPFRGVGEDCRSTVFAAALLVVLALVPGVGFGGETNPSQGAPEAQESAPPTTRHELLRRMREAKRLDVAPYRPNRVEREFLKIDKAENPTLQELNFHGIYPRVAWPSRGSSIAFGFRYWQRDVQGPLDLAGAVFYSLKGYQHYDLQFGLMPHIGRRLPDVSWRGDDVYELGDNRPGFGPVPFYVTLRYRYLPEEDYFGEGMESELEDRSSYLQEEMQAYLRTGYQFTDRIVWLVNVGYTTNDIRPGKAGGLPSTDEIFDETSAPGLTRAPDYFRYGTSVLFDFRDEPANPHNGFMVAIGAGRFEDQSENAFSFDRVGIDARAAIPLGSRQRILALRGVLLRDEADPGHRVPFFMQESLGGSHTLRGFDSFRFRGEKVMLYQAEYRWEPSPIWELALFTDAGTVASGETDLSFDRLEWDYGVGMRFKNWRSVLIRMEIAWSRETTRYYFRTSASF